MGYGWGLGKWKDEGIKRGILNEKNIWNEVVEEAWEESGWK
jgi:hypothetical protein